MCRLPPLLPDSRHNLVVHCLMDYRLNRGVCRFVIQREEKRREKRSIASVVSAGLEKAEKRK